MDLPELVIETEPKRSYPFGTLAAHAHRLSAGADAGRAADDLQGPPAGRHGRQDRASKAPTKRGWPAWTAKSSKSWTAWAGSGTSWSAIEPRQSSEARSGPGLRPPGESRRAPRRARKGRSSSSTPRRAGSWPWPALRPIDPNKFINRFTPEEWTALANNPDNPLVNRAIQGLYSPGSIFKLVMASAAWTRERSSTRRRSSAAATVQIYGRPFHCWFEAGHGTLNLSDAIRHSCNIYFYNIGRRMGIDDDRPLCRRAGAGPEERASTFRAKRKAWSRARNGRRGPRRRAWYPGETISVAIGQGPLQVTPLQIAAMTALIANRGRERPSPSSSCDASAPAGIGHGFPSRDLRESHRGHVAFGERGGDGAGRPGRRFRRLQQDGIDPDDQPGDGRTAGRSRGKPIPGSRGSRPATIPGSS